MEDDLDDTHLCIKCNATIIGIEFYISHRRRNCVIRNEQVITHAAAAKATNASDDASTATATTATATAAAAAASAASGTGAVAGVAAENSAVSTTPSAVAVVSAYDNFHQTSDSIKETQTFSPPHHDNHHHQLVHSLDADHHHHHHTRDYEYDLGADIFFSSLELCSTQSLRNHQAHPPATLITPSHPITASSPSVATAAALQAATSSASSASTLFHSRATPQTSPQVANNSGAGSGGDETAKLMSVVRAISGNRMASTTYRMLRLSQDSMAPYNCGGTAGAEKEDDDGEVDGDDDDTQENYVPSDANSTDTEEDTEYDAGVEAVQHLQHENDESEDEDSDEADEDDNEDGDAFDDHDVPPPSHTRGKWVPGSKIVRLEYKDDTVHKTTASGTGGSGISAAMPTASSDTDAQAAVANTTIASEKFHCKVCDRTLSTHISYARHLESDLHRKRSLPERELDAALRGSPRISDAELQQPQRKRVRISVDQAEAADAPKKPAKRYRRHIYIRCEVCCLRLARHMLGKHLISQYHYRHMSKKRKPYEQIFRHMPEVVRQSPFQCQPCRFYAITAAHFMLHWQSAEHAERIAAGLKSSLLWCSDCKFQCTDNAGMTAHLKGDQHQALIDMIDRSMPIIVRQKRRIACTQCGEEFQLNVQLRKHAAGSCAATPLLNAAGPEDSASDRYQSKFWCAECATLCTSQRAFQRHEILMHQRAVFFCSICDEKFGSAEAARDHRKGIQHKVLAQKRRFDAIGASAAAKVLQLKRKCRVCAVVLEDIIRLKEHLLVEHPDDFYTCLTCGFRCVLQQELSRHRRDGDCYANESAGVENEARVENETPVKNEASVENGAPVENKDESSAGLPTFHCSDCIFRWVQCEQRNETCNYNGFYNGKCVQLHVQGRSALPRIHARTGRRFRRAGRQAPAVPALQEIVPAAVAANAPAAAHGRTAFPVPGM